MPATFTIELKALRFFAHHGWHDEEAILGNDFEVSLVATVAAQNAVQSIEDTVDYVTLYTITKQLFAEREKLLETVAQKIAGKIEQEFHQIKQLQISITKLSPPIAGFVGTVGITYTTEFK